MNDSNSLPTRAFFIFSIILFSRALTPIFGDSVEFSAVAEGDRLFQTVCLAVVTGMIFQNAARLGELIREASGTKLLWALLILSAASTSWSLIPEKTLRNSMALWSTSFFGVCLALRFPTIDRQLKILSHAFVIIIVGCFLAVMVAPELAIESGSHEGAWNGLFNQKNALGRFMVLSSLVCFLHAKSEKPPVSWFAAVLTLLSISLVALSRSSTSNLNLCLMAFSLLWCRMMQRQSAKMAGLSLLTLILGLTAGLLVFSQNEETVFEFMGRDVTLTGRTEIWGLVLEQVSNRPWLGFGYGVFWTYGAMTRAFSFSAAHAHNGILDLLLDLGISGVVIFLALYFLVTLRAFRYALREKSWQSLWPMLYLIYMLLFNVTETTILTRNSLFWALFTVVACFVAQPLEEEPA